MRRVYLAVIVVECDEESADTSEAASGTKQAFVPTCSTLADVLFERTGALDAPWLVETVEVYDGCDSLRSCPWLPELTSAIRSDALGDDGITDPIEWEARCQ